MIAVGVDVGNSGAVAAVRVDTQELIGLSRFTLMDIGKTKTRNVIDSTKLHRLFREWSAVGPLHFAIELAQPKGNEGSRSVFTYGSSFGIVLALGAVHGATVELVAPQSWQAKVLATTDKNAIDAVLAKLAKRDQKATKAKAVATALRQFPGIRLVPKGASNYHTGLADAVCIAMYKAGMVAPDTQREPRQACENPPPRPF